MIRRIQFLFAVATLAVLQFLAPAEALAQASAPTATQEVAAPAAAPAPAVTKEVVDNPYGLKALWAQGDIVAKSTLIIMVLMSAGSWYILFSKLFESFKISGEAKSARSTFFKSSSLQEGIGKLKDGGAFRYIAETAVKAGEHHEGELTENIDRNTWVSMSVQRSVEEVQSRLQDGLAFLATVGSTAPFIGLFGMSISISFSTTIGSLLRPSFSISGTCVSRKLRRPSISR